MVAAVAAVGSFSAGGHVLYGDPSARVSATAGGCGSAEARSPPPLSLFFIRLAHHTHTHHITYITHVHRTNRLLFFFSHIQAHKFSHTLTLHCTLAAPCDVALVQEERHALRGSSFKGALMVWQASHYNKRLVACVVAAVVFACVLWDHHATGWLPYSAARGLRPPSTLWLRPLTLIALIHALGSSQSSSSSSSSQSAASNTFK